MPQFIRWVSGTGHKSWQCHLTEGCLLPSPGTSCPVKEPGAALCMMASSRLSLLQLHRLDLSLVVSSDDPDDALQATQICHQLAGLRDRFRTEALLAIAFPVAPRTESHPPQSSQASVATEAVTGLAPGSPAVAPPATAAGPGKDEAARAPHCADRVPNWRIDRAEKIGESHGLKLRGEISTTPTTPEPIGSTPACRFYCVLRSSDGSSPGMYTSWKIAQDHVLDQDPGATAVFCGFPSLAEVKAYCHAARAAVPKDIFTRAVPVVYLDA